ncbi:NUDIX hydrolase [Pseudonocardia sp. GCM10023141]|uniref:NUDIX hydrolase n=1 Tax=Pseudonocardia sp. GCM10023141 TaxID=3252653 RepID=UPI00360F1554
MEQPRPTRVGAYVVCVRDGALLVVRLARMRLWTLPGGGLDHGERPEAAAVREVAEETGYRVELGKLIGVDSAVWARPEPGADIHALQLVYTGQVVGGALRNELRGSTDRAEWAALPDVRTRDRSTVLTAGMAAAGLA